MVSDQTWSEKPQNEFANNIFSKLESEPSKFCFLNAKPWGKNNLILVLKALHFMLVTIPCCTYPCNVVSITGISAHNLHEVLPKRHDGVEILLRQLFIFTLLTQDHTLHSASISRTWRVHAQKLALRVKGHILTAICIFKLSNFLSLSQLTLTKI